MTYGQSLQTEHNEMLFPLSEQKKMRKRVTENVLLKLDSFNRMHIIPMIWGPLLYQDLLQLSSEDEKHLIKASLLT